MGYLIVSSISRTRSNAHVFFESINQTQADQQHSPGTHAVEPAAGVLRANDPYAGAGSGKRSLSTDGIADQIDRKKRKLNDTNGDKSLRVAYYFSDVRAGESGFNEVQKQQARRSLQAWSDVANITFEEQASQADARLSLVNSTVPAVADAMFSSSWGLVRVNPNYSNSRTPKVNGFGRHTLTHEIGHALGAAHTGNYNGDGKSGPFTYKEHATYAQDSRAYSVMSYFEASHTHQDFKGKYASSPLMADIAWAQKVYGANHKTRNTDTTYGFNSNTLRDDLSLSSSRDDAVFCVWDGGGNDTLDFSGYGQNQVINLRAESFSDVGPMKGNVSIAKGVTVENAIGGSGSDVLIGNPADNRLTGGGGPDQMAGGAGRDTFAYADASDSTLYAPDRLIDFVSGEDKIDVSSLLRKHQINALTFVNKLTGKAGEAGVGYDPQKNESWLVMDVTGDGQIDFYLESLGQIRISDIAGNVPVSYRYV
jgi:hypothetical protein